MIRHQFRVRIRALITCAQRLSACGLLVIAAASEASAQAILERVVGPGLNGFPLKFGGFVQSVIGDMSRSTEVPMGLEMAMQPHIITVTTPPVLTGLTLRAALNVLIEAVPEYEWHTADGVVVVRPRGAASIEAHPLHQTVGALQTNEIVAQQSLSVACAWLGTPGVMRLSDRQRFSMSFVGGPLIDLLNETVRQHGSLVWVFHHATGRSAGVGLSFMSGGNGRGCGAPGQPRPEGVDVEKLLGKTAVPTAPTNPLDAPLADRGGLPYAFFAIHPVSHS